MNENMIKNNIEYQDEIVKIAKMLFHAFYYDEDERPDSQEAWIIYEKLGVTELLEKSDKFYQFFEEHEEAKKTIRFLQTISPELGKKIIDLL